MRMVQSFLSIKKLLNRSPRGASYGLSLRDLKRIAYHRDFRSLKKVPPLKWTAAIKEVPIPQRGKDAALDFHAILAIATPRGCLI